MEWNVKVENGCSIVSLSGRLDAVTSPLYEQKIRELYANGPCRLAVDFDKLDYISSAGLRVLLLLAKLSKETGGKLCLANIRNTVRSVFEMSNFTTLFVIKETLAEAIAEVA